MFEKWDLYIYGEHQNLATQTKVSDSGPMGPFVFLTKHWKRVDRLLAMITIAI